MSKKVSTAEVTGASGRRYPFEVFNWETMFNPGIAGVYLIARRYKKADGKFALEPIYVGEREDIAPIFGYHPKQQCFEPYYPNCRCIYRVRDKETREFIVQDLIEELAPYCNK